MQFTESALGECVPVPKHQPLQLLSSPPKAEGLHHLSRKETHGSDQRDISLIKKKKVLRCLGFSFPAPFISESSFLPPLPIKYLSQIQHFFAHPVPFLGLGFILSLSESVSTF